MDVLNSLTNPVKLIIAALAALWLSLPTIFTILIVVSLADIVSGVLAAAISGRLSSDASLKGMAKKTMVFLLVGVSVALENYHGVSSLGAPLSQLVAGFFVAHEALSLLENAAEIGVPIPPFLRSALAKIDGKE